MNKKGAFAVSLVFLIVFLYEVIQISGAKFTFTPQPQTILLISEGLFSTYIVPFELISMILVGGIVGALYIAGREN
ncbi:MAG: hypothetical protein QW597_01085 [Thermoplasmataceae archaeon]